MLPVEHSDCVPSVPVQMKFAFSFGMQPPFTQTKPAPHELFVPHFESQWPSMQMPFVPHAPPGTVQAFGLPVQTSLFVSHE
jgi:hypothetical protein